MDIDDPISIWRKKKNETKASNKKLIQRLKKANSKKVDQLADQLHDSVFQKVDCLDCANCCTSIPPMLNDTDVRRIARNLGIKEAQFKDQYIRIDEDQDMVMASTPCPFLGEDHKCFIYEFRPKACRQYPHTNQLEFMRNSHLHVTNARYCPAVFHIMEQLKEVF